jgi:hypothetical protein
MSRWARALGMLQRMLDVCPTWHYPVPMSTTLPRFTAPRLAQIIDSQGRMKAWVAEQGGVSPSTLSLAMSGKRTLSQDSAQRIAKALGVPLFLAFDVHFGTSSVHEGTEVAV